VSAVLEAPERYFAPEVAAPTGAGTPGRS
jgi:hypothetical protein